MKFYLVDRIERIEPGKRIVCLKNLSLAEEYLADHFPIFPVMPGVLMLEALVQSAAWLIRIDQDWSNSLIELVAARNVRYGHFVAPGNSLRTEVELVDVKDGLIRFKGSGTVSSGAVAVQGKLELKAFNVADVCPEAVGADERIVEQLKERFRIIGGPEALAAARDQAG